MSTGKSHQELLDLLARQQAQIDQLTAQLNEQRQFSVLQHDSNDAITVQDFAGNITLWNRGAEKMYGWKRKQALRMNIRQIVPPDCSEDALAVIKAIAQGHNVSSFETKRLTADSRVLDVWLTLTAITDDDGHPVAVATTERDITSQHQAIKEKNDLILKLQKTNNQLRQALAETRTLRGIIPICMVCKQIRNDSGFWEQVEVYIHNHTHADFSHGICPNCLKEKSLKTSEKAMLPEGQPGPKLLSEGKGTPQS